MPKQSTKPGLIVSQFADDGVNNNILAKGVFDKYSPCNNKYIATGPTKKYISNKLNRAVHKVKHEKEDVSDVVDKKMIADIWNVLCPLKDYELETPKTLHKDILEIVNFKTKSFIKSQKNKKKGHMKFSGKHTDSDSESNSDSASQSESEDEKPVSKSKTKNNKQKSKQKSKKAESEPESESNSESNSDSD